MTVKLKKLSDQVIVITGASSGIGPHSPPVVRFKQTALIFE